MEVIEEQEIEGEIANAVASISELESFEKKSVNSTSRNKNETQGVGYSATDVNEWKPYVLSLLERDVVPSGNGLYIPDIIGFKSENENSGIPDVKQFLRPRILFWDPARAYPDFPETGICPECGGRMVFVPIIQNFYMRILYGIDEPVLLVTSTLKCRKIHHRLLGYDPRVISQLPSGEKPPFVLFHKAGLTRDLFDKIYEFASAGKKFSKIQDIITNNYIKAHQEREKAYLEAVQLYTSTNKKLASSEAPKTFPAIKIRGPRNTFVSQCFLTNFKEKELFYKLSLSHLTADEWLVLNESFRLPSNVGRKTDGSWKQQAKGVFYSQNELGQVITWQLTKSDEFEEVKVSLQLLKERHEQQSTKVLSGCFTEKCCEWRDGLKSVYGSNFQVKGNLESIIDTISGKMSTGSMYSGQCLKELRQVFREANDWGDVQTIETPDENTLLANVENFIEKWKGVRDENAHLVLSTNILRLLKDFEPHILNGCFSRIPPISMDLDTDELHKAMKSKVTNCRLGINMTVAMLSLCFHDFNKAKSDKNGQSSAPVLLVVTNEDQNPGDNTDDNMRCLAVEIDMAKALEAIAESQTTSSNQEPKATTQEMLSAAEGLLSMKKEVVNYLSKQDTGVIINRALMFQRFAEELENFAPRLPMDKKLIPFLSCAFALLQQDRSIQENDDINQIVMDILKMCDDVEVIDDDSVDKIPEERPVKIILYDSAAGGGQRGLTITYTSQKNPPPTDATGNEDLEQMKVDEQPSLSVEQVKEESVEAQGADNKEGKEHAVPVKRRKQEIEESGGGDKKEVLDVKKEQTVDKETPVRRQLRSAKSTPREIKTRSTRSRIRNLTDDRTKKKGKPLVGKPADDKKSLDVVEESRTANEGVVKPEVEDGNEEKTQKNVQEEHTSSETIVEEHASGIQQTKSADEHTNQSSNVDVAQVSYEQINKKEGSELTKDISLATEAISRKEVNVNTLPEKETKVEEDEVTESTLEDNVELLTGSGTDQGTIDNTVPLSPNEELLLKPLSKVLQNALRRTDLHSDKEAYLKHMKENMIKDSSLCQDIVSSLRQQINKQLSEENIDAKSDNIELEPLVRSVANSLGSTISVLTSLEYFPVIPIFPQKLFPASPPLLLLAAKGDNFIPVGLKPRKDREERSLIKKRGDESVGEKFVPRCRCGRGGKSKSEGKCFTHADAKYITRCLCYRLQEPCGSQCDCKGCCNPYGIRPEKKPVQLNAKRRRFSHLAQNLTKGLGNGQYSSGSGVELNLDQWSLTEQYLFEALIGEVKMDEGGTLTTDFVAQRYNEVAQVAMHVPGLQNMVGYKTPSQVQERLQEREKDVQRYLELYQKQLEILLSRQGIAVMIAEKPMTELEVS